MNILIHLPKVAILFVHSIYFFFKHLGIFLDIAADIIFELVPTEKMNQITLSDYFL